MLVWVERMMVLRRKEGREGIKGWLHWLSTRTHPGHATPCLWLALCAACRPAAP